MEESGSCGVKTKILLLRLRPVDNSIMEESESCAVEAIESTYHITSHLISCILSMEGTSFQVRMRHTDYYLRQRQTQR